MATQARFLYIGDVIKHKDAFGIVYDIDNIKSTNSVRVYFRFFGEKGGSYAITMPDDTTFEVVSAEVGKKIKHLHGIG